MAKMSPERKLVEMATTAVCGLSAVRYTHIYNDKRNYGRRVKVARLHPTPAQRLQIGEMIQQSTDKRVVVGNTRQKGGYTDTPYGRHNAGFYVKFVG